MIDFVPLTSNQITAIYALDWLLDVSEDRRRSGRSLAWGAALIRQALRHPGRRIAYCDHITSMGGEEGYENQRRIMYHVVRNLIARHPELDRLQWEFPNMRYFWLASDQLVDTDWMPMPHGTMDPVVLGPEPEPPPEPELSEPAFPAPTCWERLLAEKKGDNPFD